MNGRAHTALLLLVALLMIAAAPPVGAQRPTSQPPSGDHIIARDGDVIVVENDAQVGVVRRRGAYARVVFNAEERWFLLLVDHATPGGVSIGPIASGRSTARGRLARDGDASRSTSTPSSAKAARVVWESRLQMVSCNCSRGRKSSAIEMPWRFFRRRHREGRARVAQHPDARRCRARGRAAVALRPDNHRWQANSGHS